MIPGGVRFKSYPQFSIQNDEDFFPLYLFHPKKRQRVTSKRICLPLKETSEPCGMWDAVDVRRLKFSLRPRLLPWCHFPRLSKGFHSGTPNSWMVDFTENPRKMDQACLDFVAVRLWFSFGVWGWFIDGFGRTKSGKIYLQVMAGFCWKKNMGVNRVNGTYPLVNIQKAMENH